MLTGHATTDVPGRTSGPDCAVFYVTDTPFLLPTLVSAASLRRYVTAAEADVHVVTVGVPEAMVAKVEGAMRGRGVAFWPLDPARFEAIDRLKFNRTHVPPVAIGRFFMTECVPRTYDRMVYLDGDTWIAQDPGALIRVRPGPDELLAAEDISFFFRHHAGGMGQRVRAYAAGLGLDIDRGYFNSGVLAARWETWKDIAAEASDVFLSQTERCLYHDQSALNVVAQGRRVRLSPEWNFTPHFSQWGFEALVEPRIYHFAGGHKPWMGSFAHFPLWGERFREAMQEFAGLDLPVHGISDRERGRVNLRKRAYAVLQRTVLRRRQALRRMDFSQICRFSARLDLPSPMPARAEPVHRE